MTTRTFLRARQVSGIAVAVSCIAMFITWFVAVAFVRAVVDAVLR